MWQCSHDGVTCAPRTASNRKIVSFASGEVRNDAREGVTFTLLGSIKHTDQAIIHRRVIVLMTGSRVSSTGIYYHCKRYIIHHRKYPTLIDCTWSMRTFGGTHNCCCLPFQPEVGFRGFLSSPRCRGRYKLPRHMFCFLLRPRPCTQSTLAWNKSAPKGSNVSE